MWKNLAKGQCNFFNALFHQLEKEGSHLYTRVFQVLHSDVPTLLPNQEIKFLSETEHPLNEEDEDTDVNETQVLMIFLLCQKSIDWNHTDLNTMNNYQVILILYIQRIILVTIVTTNIEKRDLSVHLLKDFTVSLEALVFLAD